MGTSKIREIEASSLVGEVLTYVDAFEDEILLTTASGRQIVIKHNMPCCASVTILDTEGEWNNLLGKVIIDASNEVVEEGERASYDHYTRTDLTFRVDGATVVSKWIGESNGYYSESVDIYEVLGNYTPPKRD